MTGLEQPMTENKITRTDDEAYHVWNYDTSPMADWLDRYWLGAHLLTTVDAPIPRPYYGNTKFTLITNVWRDWAGE